MIENLMDIVSDEDIDKRYIERDGYCFSTFFGDPKIFDAIVIRNPIDCRNISPRCGYSKRSLDEHIKLVNDNKLEKAIIIANDIGFISECPSLCHIEIIPDNDFGDGFDYSPLYNHKGIKTLDCTTQYGKFWQYRTNIDYSSFEELERLHIFYDGHHNYLQLRTLKKLRIAFSKSFAEFGDEFCGENLEEIDITQCGIKSLKGIERAAHLRSAEFCYNRSLTNLDALACLKHSLKALTIESCPKVGGWEILRELHELEYLRLCGGNTISNLEFLAHLPKLRAFEFSINIEDGNLQPCMQIPYVHCIRGKRHYNLKNSDLPKELIADENPNRTDGLH